jgi:hypothetical protein
MLRVTAYFVRDDGSIEASSTVAEQGPGYLIDVARKVAMGKLHWDDAELITVTCPRLGIVHYTQKELWPDERDD